MWSSTLKCRILDLGDKNELSLEEECDKLTGEDILQLLQVILIGSALVSCTFVFCASQFLAISNRASFIIALYVTDTDRQTGRQTDTRTHKLKLGMALVTQNSTNFGKLSHNLVEHLSS